MAIVMVLIAVAVLAVPGFATVVVSLASVREDRAWSLYRKPQKSSDAMARRIVGFHAEGTVPQPKSHRTAVQTAHAAGRFAGHTARPAKVAAPSVVVLGPVLILSKGAPQAAR
jgi:hypothetical protein